MRAFSLQHLKRYGFLPHLKEDPEHPQLKRWFAQKSPHINAFGPNAPSHHDWSKLKPAACKLFDEIVDLAALLDDKTIGLPGSEMLTVYKPEHLGARMEQATHSRRLLIETWTNKQVSFRGFLADLAAKKVKWGELMLAMTAKEKTTNRIGRLFTYSTLRVRTFSSTLERNMKDSIFPDVAEQTKTLSDVQLHKKFMEHGSSLKPVDAGCGVWMFSRCRSAPQDASAEAQQSQPGYRVS